MMLVTEQDEFLKGRAHKSNSKGRVKCSFLSIDSWTFYGLKESFQVLTVESRQGQDGDNTGKGLGLGLSLRNTLITLLQSLKSLVVVGGWSRK